MSELRRGTTVERHQTVLPFTPRPWQRPLLEDGHKRIVAVVHRRAGKSTALMWRGIRRAITERRPMPRVVHILPFAVMWSRTGLWDQLTAAAKCIPRAEVRKAQMSVAFANGGTFQCGGADNQDSWRGGYADECILDEYDDTPPSMVPLVIEPMLADRDGTLIRSGTPKGRGLLQAAYEKAKQGGDYSHYLLDYRQTKVLPDEVIERLRREMSEEEFAQELCCSFQSPNSGSYYGKLLEEADQEGRITMVPHDPQLKVTTAWDLGIDDSTVVWFVQISPSGQWRIIDYLEGSGEGLEYYVRQLQKRNFVYDRHILPHDVQVRELGSGRSRREVLAGLGIRPQRVVRQHSVADGIEAVRIIIPKCWFDAERTAPGLRSLKGYRREWNELAQAWRSQPVHDYASHAADAFRYLALGVRDGDRRPVLSEPWSEAFVPSAGAWNAGWMRV